MAKIELICNKTSVFEKGTKFCKITLILPSYSPLASAVTTNSSNLTFLSSKIDIEFASSMAGIKSTSSP